VGSHERSGKKTHNLGLSFLAPNSLILRTVGHGFFFNITAILKKPHPGFFLLVNFRKTGVQFDIITGKGWGSFFYYITIVPKTGTSRKGG